MLNKRVIHWFVLMSLVLGQLAMSASMASAQTPDDSHTKVPVCTSAGIVFVSWPDSNTDQTATVQSPAWGVHHLTTCIWCTVAPAQFRFDTHRDVLVKPSETTCMALVEPTSVPLQWFPGNPHAAPRAPPLA